MNAENSLGKKSGVGLFTQIAFSVTEKASGGPNKIHKFQDENWVRVF